MIIYEFLKVGYSSLKIKIIISLKKQIKYFTYTLQLLQSYF